MLVLSRKVGERVVVGDVSIKIVRVSNKQVRIAIEAPQDVKVLRGELVEADRGRDEEERAA